MKTKIFQQIQQIFFKRGEVPARRYNISHFAFENFKRISTKTKKVNKYNKLMSTNAAKYFSKEEKCLRADTIHLILYLKIQRYISRNTTKYFSKYSKIFQHIQQNISTNTTQYLSKDEKCLRADTTHHILYLKIFQHMFRKIQQNVFKKTKNKNSTNTTK